MADVPITDPIEVLKAATHPIRLQLLMLASVGLIHSADAKRLAGVAAESKSGGPQWHLTQLANAGLLERERHGEYVLTPSGRALLAAVGYSEPPTESGGSVAVSVDGRDAEALLPPGAELVAVLTRRLPGDREETATIRAVRTS